MTLFVKYFSTTISKSYTANAAERIQILKGIVDLLIECVDSAAKELTNLICALIVVVLVTLTWTFKLLKFMITKK